MTGEKILFADNQAAFLNVRKEFLLRAGYPFPNRHFLAIEFQKLFFLRLNEVV